MGKNSGKTRSIAGLLLSAVLILAFAAAMTACGEKDSTGGSGPDISETAKYETIFAMSFNIRTENSEDAGARAWEERKDDVVGFILGSGADVICLQEVRRTQYEYIRDEVEGEYGIVYYPREDGDNPEGLAVLYGDMFELVSSDRFWLSDTPDKMGPAWGAHYNRICVSALLRSDGGAYLNVFDVHLDHESVESQNKGIELIMSRVKEAGYPAMMCGDFNTDENYECYKIAASAMDDARKTASLYSDEADGITYNGWGTETSPYGNLIDHIFISRDLTADTYEICDDKTAEGNYYSDHYAIMSLINVPVAEDAE